MTRFFLGEDLLEYNARLTALAQIMQQITFGSLETYDYVSPTPERVYAPEEIPLLSKRHQARISKAEKARKKGDKFNTLECKDYLYVIILCVM